MRELRTLSAVGADSRSADWSPGDSRNDSYTASRRPSQQSSEPSPPRGPVFERAPSVAETNGPATPSNPGTPLTWIERENICDRIGKFLVRSLEGNHRGTSGRELLPNSSRIWVVVRDYEKVIYTPVRVFRTWTPAKQLVKPNGADPGDSIFVGLPSEREARQAVFAAQLPWPT